MNAPDLNEAVALTTNVVLTALLNTIQGQTGLEGATLRNQCGALSANAATMLSLTPEGDRSFWIALSQCFDAAQQVSSVTFQLMDNVRLAALGATPTGLPAIAVQNFSVRMALLEESRILAATDFVSRNDVEDFFNQITASFQTAELLAADNQDNIAYIALVNLHAAVSNDLTTRARPLPRIVTVTTPRTRTALGLAQMLYQDGSRANELVAENKPIRPMCMPLSVRALSF